MASQVPCPHCGMFKVATIHIQTIEPSVKDTAHIDTKQESRWVLIVLLLSLTVIGLPIAYWLCKQLEKDYPVCEAQLQRYSYKCSVCGYAWLWRTDEPLPPSTSKNSLSRRADAFPPIPTRPASFLSNVVTWWLKV